MQRSDRRRAPGDGSAHPPGLLRGDVLGTDRLGDRNVQDPGSVLDIGAHLDQERIEPIEGEHGAQALDELDPHLLAVEIEVGAPRT